VFSELQSHYVFDDRFGRPGKGNDKGKVEGLVGWIRRNLMVPVPRRKSAKPPSGESISTRRACARSSRR
jgi:transposase